MSFQRLTQSIPMLALVTTLCLPSIGFSRTIRSPKPLPFPDVQVYTEPGSLPELKAQQNGKEVKFPLEHTHAKVEISGSVAKVELTQTYRNTFKTALEGIYVFPLPENSAVGGMKIVIGDRVIEAKIQERQQAKRTYEAAKQAGKTAALLEQERPNIFTQSVANIAPGTDIDVVIEYLQELTYDAGQYEFVFPMVVGPRFFPGQRLARGPSGKGTKVDTDEVPDASRISPPVFGKGNRNGHDISMEVSVVGKSPIFNWNVPTHDVVRRNVKRGGLQLSLASHDKLPNRDFILQYSVARSTPSISVLTHRDLKEDGFFSLSIQPPRLDVDDLVGSREIIFVVDVSGSMHGVPLAMSQAAMKEAISKLRPVDTFNIYSFAGRTGRAFEDPRPANKTNMQAGLNYITGLRAGGGTHMANAVREALSPNPNRDQAPRNRYVFFLTDGYVGNEKALFEGASQLVAALGKEGQKARVFGFGVGSSVNRHLLDGLSKAGNGITVYASTRQDPTLAVNKFFHYIDRPILENISIDWGDLETQSPQITQDLFASRPLTIHGRYSQSGADTIIVRGEMNGRPVEFPIEVQLPKAQKKNSALRSVWARNQIELLGQETWNASSQTREEVKTKITKLGLHYKLVTAYTSLVAVDSESQVDTDGSKSVLQPVHTPEGVNAAMAGAAIANSYTGRRLMMGGRGPMRKSLSRSYPSKARGRGTLGGIAKELSPRAVPASPAAEEDSVTAPPILLQSERVSKKEKKKVLKPSVKLKDMSIKAQFDRFIKNKNCQCNLSSASVKRALADMKLQFFLTPDGRVIQLTITEKSIKTSRLAKYIQKCLRRSLKNWRFTHRNQDFSKPITLPATLLLP